MGIFNPQSSYKKWTLGALQKTGELTDQSIQGFQPYANTGTQAFNTLAGAYGLGGETGRNAAEAGFRESPGYDFRMSEGINAIDRSAASRGNLQSGGTLKALTRYGQGVADQEYDNYLQGLSGLSSTGLGALGQQAGLREQQSGRIFSGYQGIGQAQTNQNLGFLNLGVNTLTALAKAAAGAPGLGGGAGGIKSTTASGFLY